jgi:hypothetical protein
VAVSGADAERGKVAQWRTAYLPPDPASRTAYAAGEIAGACDAGLPGISSFAKGLEQDLNAVTQGLTSRWNSGPSKDASLHQDDQTTDVRTRQPAPPPASESCSPPRTNRRPDLHEIGARSLIWPLLGCW